jgi:hypothetical protein
MTINFKANFFVSQLLSVNIIFVRVQSPLTISHSLPQLLTNTTYNEESKVER